MADSGRKKQGRGRGKGVAGGVGDTDDESELEMSSDFSSGESSDEAVTTSGSKEKVDVDNGKYNGLFIYSVMQAVS